MDKKGKRKVEPAAICDLSVEMQDKPAKIAAKGENFHSEIANCDIQSNGIASMIRLIRGRQVIIDRDLSMLYNVETKVLNQAVKRNIERFPERFRFQLSKEEMNELVTNCDRFKTLKHSSSASYAFTEQGISMLSTDKCSMPISFSATWCARRREASF